MDILTWLSDVGLGPFALLFLYMLVVTSLILAIKAIIRFAILIMKIRYSCPLEFEEEYVKKERNCAR